MKKILYVSPYKITDEQAKFLCNHIGDEIDIMQMNITVKNWYRIRKYFQWQFTGDVIIINIPEDNYHYSSLYTIHGSILPFKISKRPEGWKDRAIIYMREDN